MCLAPEVDLVAGVVISAVGIDTLRHLDRRREVVIGSLPLLFGLHQLVETVVWWSVDGTIDATSGRAAMWIYLFFALPVLPVLVPLALLLVEAQATRRRWLVGLLALGAVVAAVLAWQLLDGTVNASAGTAHIKYVFGLQWPIVVIGGYLIATCGPLLVSSWPTLRWWGAANLVVVGLIGVAAAEGFLSLWCFWAAITSVAINLTLRRHRHDRATDVPLVPAIDGTLRSTA